MATNGTVGDPGHRSLDPAAIVQEVEEWYRVYMDAFSRRDLDHIKSHVAETPYAELATDGSIVIHDDELDTQYSEAFEAFEANGWAHTSVDDVRICALADNLAMVIPTVTRYDVEGTPVLSGKRVVYLVRRSPDGWRIGAYAYIADGYATPEI